MKKRYGLGNAAFDPGTGVRKRGGRIKIVQTFGDLHRYCVVMLPPWQKSYLSYI
jgi:hypothetical protein